MASDMALTNRASHGVRGSDEREHDDHREPRRACNPQTQRIGSFVSGDSSVAVAESMPESCRVPCPRPSP